MSNSKIVSVELKKNAKFDPTDVIATFDDGRVAKIFDYFEDEISFFTNELIGLTEKEAGDLYMKKDMHYLRS